MESFVLFFFEEFLVQTEQDIFRMLNLNLRFWIFFAAKAMIEYNFAILLILQYEEDFQWGGKLRIQAFAYSTLFSIAHILGPHISHILMIYILLRHRFTTENSRTAMKYTGSIKDMRSCMWLRNHIKISCRFSIFFLGKNIITYLYICAFCHCFHCHCYRHICYYCHRRNHIKISCRFSIFFLERTVEYEQCQLYSILTGCATQL